MRAIETGIKRTGKANRQKSFFANALDCWLFMNCDYFFRHFQDRKKLLLIDICIDFEYSTAVSAALKHHPIYECSADVYADDFSCVFFFFNFSRSTRVPSRV